MLARLATCFGFAAIASAASLQLVTNFGANPTNVSMYIYVPDNLAAKPPVLLFPHWCHGDAQAAYAGSQYASLADTYGFVVIYPDSPNTADKCWDVSSANTLTHNGGGDSLGIVSMAKYALEKYKGDPNRVFVTGVSSGAMMTNVLIGAYPDLFAAGSVYFFALMSSLFSHINLVLLSLVYHSAALQVLLTTTGMQIVLKVRSRIQVLNGPLLCVKRSRPILGGDQRCKSGTEP